MTADSIFIIGARTNKTRRLYHRRRSIIREFALNTSSHGIPGIARSRSIHNRIFWSVSFVIFVGIALYFIIHEIGAYFQYSTQTSVKMVNEWPQHFPAFTICNLAPVRNDRFVEALANYTNTYNITNSNNTKNSTASLLLKQMSDFFQMKINRNESLKEFFFPLDAMLMKCNFNGISCSAINFTSFSSSLYGFCYTFNAKLKNISNVLYSNGNGGPGRLSLRFYVHSHQYVPYIREGIGLIAMVHDNAELPQIDYAGMALTAGFTHRITYTKRTISYLRSPYSNCDEKVPPMMQAMFDNYEGAEYGYSEDICYDLCAGVYTYQKCGCINPTQWNARLIVLPETGDRVMAPLCNSTDRCYSKAINVFLTTPDILEQNCTNCPPKCFITSFNTKESAWKAPQAWLINDIKAFAEKSQIPLPLDWSTNWPSYVDSSYLSVELIHESTLVENYMEEPAMSPVDVLSNVGGQTGLWIGVSFLSLMELAEMLYRLIRYQIHITRKTSNKTDSESKA